MSNKTKDPDYRIEERDLDLQAMVSQSDRITSIMRSIKNEIIKKEPDLLTIKSLLYEHKTILTVFSTLLLKSMQADSKIMPLESFTTEKTKQIFGDVRTFDEFYKKYSENTKDQLKTVDSIILLINKTPREKIEELRDTIFIFIGDVESRLIVFNASPTKRKHNDPMSQVLEFISLGVAGITENWVPAVCYLAAIDILVNQKRKQFGLSHPIESKEIGTSFEQKYKDLITHMESKGSKFSEIMKPVPNIFWNIRTKVIHYGEVPSPKELEMIIVNSKEIINMLSQ